MKIIGLASYKNGVMNLPKSVRELLKLEKEGKIVFYLKNGDIIIKKA